MTVPVSIPELQRPAFFDGQRLDAVDLAAMYDFHRELRWLHNRALHNWGIAVGFGVAGTRGAREVHVAPGYAIDCLGHDLLLARPVTLPVPAVSGAAAGGPALYYLTASYVDDADLPPSETREGVCEGGGAVRRIESPRLRWQMPGIVGVPENRFRRGIDVVLAAVLIADCALTTTPSRAERRSARPATQPFVAAGSTTPGTTAWRFYSGVGGIAGVETTVDTSSAGFRSTPNYTAQVIGTRVLKADVGGASSGQLLDGFASVVSPTASSFVLRLLMPRNLQVGPYQLNPSAVFVNSTLDTLRTALKWSVSWMGVEG